ncbi:MAG: alkaline phosphatase family protein [Thermoanaerobaculia bacterium]
MPATGQETPTRGRTLLIALDAVPYAPVARLADPALGEDAIFRGFQGPVPLISSFPSTTSLALGGILGGIGLERSPGYEHRYYDLDLGKKRGGGPISYNKLLFPWRKFFDFQTGGIFRKGVKLFRLDKASRKIVADLVAAFLASDKTVFHAYVDLTDMIAHIDGPDGVEPFLRYLDRELLDLRAEHPELDLTVVIYSDHGIAGGEPLKNVRRNVDRALRRDGFRRVRHLRERNDVVFVPYGLVSSFVAFTRPGEKVAAARAIAGAEGVDICVADDRAGYKIVGRHGSARVLHRSGPEGGLYGYRALYGDPLGYVELASGPGPGGEPAPWRRDRWWLQATSGHPYPDALYRIHRAFDLVEHPASVVCSVAEGYMYGAAYTNFGSRLSPFGRLRFTHGALTRGDSLGFVISDDENWRPPSAARFDEALAPWGD